MDKVERAGTGIQRRKDSMVAAGLPLPRIKYDTFFTITLMRPPKEEKDGSVKRAEKGSEKILEAIRGNRRISTREIGKKVGISQRAVEKLISRLKREGSLNRVGPDKGGYWEIIEKE